MIDTAAIFRPDDDAPVGQPTGWASILRSLLEMIIEGASAGLRNAEAAMALAGQNAAGLTRSEWRRFVRESYGVDIVRGEPWLADLMSGWEQTNLGLIRSIPDTIVGQIRTEMSQAMTQGTSLRNLKAIVRERCNVGDARAELIARDQVGKLTGQLAQYRQVGIGVTSYIWRTAGDERVRDSHRALNGKTCSWKKAPAIGHPGQPIRCRCYADPILPEMTETEVQLLG
jgi:SPP1 gp7 family putative phage head morphogenesis protein